MPVPKRIEKRSNRMADIQISLAAARVNAGLTQEEVAREIQRPRERDNPLHHRE